MMPASHPGSGFRRHRVGEQGCSLPPPAPQASLSLFPNKKRWCRPRNPAASLRREAALERATRTTIGMRAPSAVSLSARARASAYVIYRLMLVYNDMKGELPAIRLQHS
jgi:hypothetical protein